MSTWTFGGGFEPFTYNGQPIVLGDAPEHEIKQVSQVFQADMGFAWEHGGDFVRALIEELPGAAPGYRYIIDSKLHMLKPGWYPGIPGWHLDFAPGWETVVDLELIDDAERHYAVISHGHSRTEYVAERVALDVPDNQPRLNGYLSRQIAALDERVRIAAVDPLVIYTFGQRDPHRVMPATTSGWRLFVRASHTRLREPCNQLRAQQQVYILRENEHAGW